MSRQLVDSGIDWLGIIPKNWNVKPIGSLFHIRNVKVSDRDYMPLSVTKTSEGIVPQMEHVAKSDSHDDRKLVLKNDFVINSRSDRRMSCGVSNYDGSVSLINTVMYSKGQMIPEYYHYVLKNQCFADEFYRWGHGIVADLWTTGWDEMKRISLCYPNKEEQIRISSCISKKESEIDALIRNQERQISLYEEYRVSFTNDIIIKGLNNEEKKFVTYEEINAIPKSWNIVNLNSLISSVQNGYVGPTKDILNDEGVRYLQSLHVKNGKIQFERCEYYVGAEWGDKHPKVSTGDLVIVQTGDIGQTAVITEEYDKCNCHALIIIKVKKHLVEPCFLNYYFQSKIGKELLLKTKTGALLPHLNSGRIGSTVVVLPSIKEQLEIVKVLDVFNSKLDSLIALKQQKIESLKEYKKSLIYEYVTGKKEGVVKNAN